MNSIGVMCVLCCFGQECYCRSLDTLLCLDCLTQESKSSKPGEAQMNGALRRGKAQGTGWTSARSVGRSQAADTWVEVYCDGEDEGRGRWVHVQPLLGWIDRCSPRSLN